MNLLIKILLIAGAAYGIAVAPAAKIDLIDPAPASRGKALWFGIADVLGGLNLFHPSIRFDKDMAPTEKFGFVRIIKDQKYLCQQIISISEVIPQACLNINNIDNQRADINVSSRELHLIAIGWGGSRLSARTDLYASDAMAKWIAQRLPPYAGSDFSVSSILDRSYEHLIESESLFIMQMSEEAVSRRKEIMKSAGIMVSSDDQPSAAEIMNYMGDINLGIDGHVAKAYFARLLKIEDPTKADFIDVSKEAQRQAHQEGVAVVVKEMWQD